MNFELKSVVPNDLETSLQMASQEGGEIKSGASVLEERSGLGW
jgi:hypothetical protein